jgi:hypothetical protein
MHGAYGINKLNEQAVAHHQAILRLNEEHAEVIRKQSKTRSIGAGSGDVKNGTNAQPA